MAVSEPIFQDFPDPVQDAMPVLRRSDIGCEQPFSPFLLQSSLSLTLFFKTLAAHSSDLLSSPGENRQHKSLSLDISFDNSLGKVLAAAAAASATSSQSGV